MLVLFLLTTYYYIKSSLLCKVIFYFLLRGRDISFIYLPKTLTLAATNMYKYAFTFYPPAFNLGFKLLIY